jgi:hypothetical protein
MCLLHVNLTGTFALVSCDALLLQGVCTVQLRSADPGVLVTCYHQDWVMVMQVTCRDQTNPCLSATVG